MRDSYEREVAVAVLLESVVYDHGCWTRVGLPADRYSHAKYGERNVCGHRAVYELLVGPIPHGLELDHLCRNRACVNPLHLEPVTHKENVRRGASGPRTHCPRGHAYNDANTRVSFGKVGAIIHCRECEKATSKRAYSRPERKAAENARRRERVEDGLCRDCPAIAVAGRTLCVECLRKNRERASRWYHS